QVYLQNVGSRDAYPFCTFSERDYFLKSAKVFGRDVKPAERLLKRALDYTQFYRDADGPTLQFPPDALAYLRRDFPQMEVAISSHIVAPQSEEGDAQGATGEDERSAEKGALLELRLDLTTPATFECSVDL
ncbi:MAG: hypothetical protein LBO07_02460, partial [Coriobacteriales bacterium]|nr:hypothetical protein [Coriobacteriales bacterium]